MKTTVEKQERTSMDHETESTEIKEVASMSRYPNHFLIVLVGLCCLSFLYAVSVVQADPEAAAPAQKSSADSPSATKSQDETDKPVKGKEVDLTLRTDDESPATLQEKRNRNLILQDDQRHMRIPMQIPMRTPSEYWIGVQVAPVPTALLSQFGITEDLEDDAAALAYVETVVPESPAAKAGVQRGDVLLSFGDKTVHALSDLVEQVEKVKDTEQSLKLIRNGKEMELKVTPTLRPEEMRQAGPIMPLPGGDPDQMRQMLRQLREEMEKFHQDGRGIGNLLDLDKPQIPGLIPLQPGASTDSGEQQDSLKTETEADKQNGENGQKAVVQTTQSAAKVQANGDEINRLEVSSRTDGDGKTTIYVKQIIQTGDKKDEKKWEVESLDELPESLRAEVKSMLGK